MQSEDKLTAMKPFPGLSAQLIGSLHFSNYPALPEHGWESAAASRGAGSKWAGTAGIRDEASVFWRGMIHPHAESSGADSGFVVAADVISEKELKSCFVSQIVSLKLSSLKKNLILSENGRSNPKPLIQACWRPPAWFRAGAGRGLRAGRHRGCSVPPAHLGVLSGGVSGATGPRLLLAC